MPKNADRSNQTKDRKKKPVTRNYLFNAGGYYLQRYSSSEANFRNVLLRKTRRRDNSDTTEEEINAWIDDVCESYCRMGAIDDAAYAENKVLSLRRNGKSRAWIANTLRSKGVAEELVARAFEAHEAMNDEDDEWNAAVQFAKRKAFGPFSRACLQGATEDPAVSAKIRNRQLASFARAGFQFSQARKILDAKDPDDLIDQ